MRRCIRAGSELGEEYSYFRIENIEIEPIGVSRGGEGTANRATFKMLFIFHEDYINWEVESVRYVWSQTVNAFFVL